MKKPKLLSWTAALFRLDRIPELIKFLVVKGENYQRIRYNDEIRQLFAAHNFSDDDFMPYLIAYNYRNLYYLWSQQGPYSLPNLIERLERKAEWHPGSWRAYLSPVEIQALLDITEHANVNLDYLYQGLTGEKQQTPRQRLLGYLRGLQSRIGQELQLLAPYEEDQLHPITSADH